MGAPHLPYRLDGKVALVTGSGRGIGAAIAIELGRLGAKVVINYANSVESAEKVVAEIKTLGSDAIAFRADIRQVPQTIKLMDNAVAHFGGLDIVASNSGVVSFGHLGDVTEVRFVTIPISCLASMGLARRLRHTYAPDLHWYYQYWKSSNQLDRLTVYGPLTLR